jgi:hypothetical protein
MRRTSLSLGFAAAALLLLAQAPAQAQATRTWVSGVGDDANPCSRTAPCKTFAGAISKTAAGGTISVLDPGGFGAVTITKSITIEGDGTLASILGAGTNGVVINAAASDTIILRNLIIEGAGTGLNGIRFLNGLALYVQNCTINRFTQKGIDFEPTGGSLLFVKDTVIRNNNFGAGGGIFIKPGAAGSSAASLDNVNLDRNLIGLRVEGNSRVAVKNAFISGNSNEGILAFTSTGLQPVINVVDSIVTMNGSGIKADGNGAIVRVGGSSIVNNNAAGWAFANSGQLLTFGDNNLTGNTPDGAASAVSLGKD